MASHAILTLITCHTLINLVNCGHNHPRLNESWSKISDIWDYDHQDTWPASCFGTHQSPINLINKCDDQVNQIDLNSIDLAPTKIPAIYDPSLELIFFNNYHQLLPSSSLRITNNGHTVQVVLRRSSRVNNWSPKLTGSAGNFDIYQFNHLHFHWHQNDLDGSEHAINNERGAVEMHMVHFNTKYRTLRLASNHVDGLLVLGTIFKVTSDSIPSTILAPVLNELKAVAKYNSSKLMSRPLRLSTFLPQNTKSYFKYVGSLTTPPCSETVTWIIFTSLMDISLDQLELFDELDSKENQMLINTNRRLQPLNDRFLYVSDKSCN